MNSWAAAGCGRRRSERDLLIMQLDAIDAWNVERRPLVAGDGLDAPVDCRQAQVARRRAAAGCRRELEGLQAQVAEQLRATGRPLSDSVPIRAIVAHRNPWTRNAIAGVLSDAGICVVALLEDGAHTLGAAVAEQPDVVFVEDRLPSLSGVEVVTLLGRFAPQAVVAVQALHAGRVRELLSAGARAVFTRQVPPEEVVAQTLSCMDNDAPAFAVISSCSDGRQQAWPHVPVRDLLPRRPVAFDLRDQRVTAVGAP